MLCAVCEERVGVYEPIYTLEEHGMRRTSLAREPDLAQRDVAAVHASCRGTGNALVHDWRHRADPVRQA